MENSRGVWYRTPGMQRRAYSAPRRPRLLTVTDGGRSAVVMIGPVRGPAHVAVIHRLHFYHVPVSAVAASRAGVAFIAFYEPASRFGVATGVIREFARVVGVSRVRRGDLPGLTWPGRGNADTPYYRFDLGPLLPLPRPITNPERRRVVFRFPEVDQFLRAATVAELGRGIAGRGPSFPGPSVARRRASGRRNEEDMAP